MTYAMRLMLVAVIAGAIAGQCFARAPAASFPASTTSKIPVILDTDIGNDVDDAWALAMLLKNPRFDLKLITTTDGKADYRARLIAKLLTAAGRSDVPIGLGVGQRTGGGSLSAWTTDYPLSRFAGMIHKDGVAALINTVHHAGGRITIIAIGPLQTLSAALARDPAIAGKVDLVAMQGSVRRGYGGSNTPEPEFNVKMDIPAAQQVFAAPWHSATITPLDTCGLPEVSLSGPPLDALRRSDDPLVQAVLQCAAIYAHKPNAKALNATSMLYDTVAVYLADPAHHPLLNLEDLKLTVTARGMTIIAARGRRISVATSWKDLPAYRDHLAARLLAQSTGRVQ